MFKADMHLTFTSEKPIIGTWIGCAIFLCSVAVLGSGSPAAAAEIGTGSSLDTIVFILKNPDISPAGTINRARELLKERIWNEPALIGNLDPDVIARYPDLFNRRLLTRLFDNLKNDSRSRPASNAIVALGLNARSPKLVEEITTGITAAFDHEDSSWWAADMTSRLARKRPQVINNTITDRLFVLMEDETAWITASAAIDNITLNTRDKTLRAALLERVLAALGHPRTERPAAYILFKISAEKPQHITHRLVGILFSLINRAQTTAYDRAGYAELTYERNRNAALYASDALAMAASLTKEDGLSQSILSKAFTGLSHPKTARLSFFIITRISESKPHLLTPSHLTTLFSIIAEARFAAYAAEVVAAVLSHTKDEDKLADISGKVMDRLGKKDSARWAADILAGAGDRWISLIDASVVERLMPLLEEGKASSNASTVLTRIALKTNDRGISKTIIHNILLELIHKDPDSGKARRITEIARTRPDLLAPHIEGLIHLLQVDAIKSEISLGLYFLLISEGKVGKRHFSKFIEDKLANGNMERPLHGALLLFAQKISYELDRLHLIDGENRKMRDTIADIPDALLYVVLAQGVEGYITTFKEVHRAFKQRQFNNIYPLDVRTDDDRLWDRFRQMDPFAHFSADLLYAYSAKGHLRYIIPTRTGAKQDMVDAAIDLIENAHGVEEVKNKGILMADALTLFSRHPKTEAYARSRLLGSYRTYKTASPKNRMFASLIFRNRDVFKNMLNHKEKADLIHSGRYVDFSIIPKGLNAKDQKLFLYFTASQKGYLTRIIDYYTGNEELFVGDGTRPHPHAGRIKGFAIDQSQSTRGISDGMTADVALAEHGTVKVVLSKSVANGNRITCVISNSPDELEMAIGDIHYTAFGFAGHSGESWVFRNLIGENMTGPERPVWIYDGSCGSARRVTAMVKNRNVFLFGNLETGKGPVNQIQIYYIAHYLAKGTFGKWHELRQQMTDEHTGYTSKLFYPGNPADNVLKNYLINMP